MIGKYQSKTKNLAMDYLFFNGQYVVGIFVYNWFPQHNLKTTQTW